MTHKILDTCIACGACETECSTQAISSGDPIYAIDASKCTDCGTCVESCPVSAIIKE
ncbi:MAG: 4Fe-4S binding protein [Candidatus Margulisiibacteriota bacterium]